MAEDIVVGSVAVEVVPTARGFVGKLDAQISPEMRAVGKQIGERLGRDIAAPIAPAVARALREAGSSAGTEGRKAGNDFGGSFATLAKTRIEAAFKALPKAHVGTDATELDAELVAIRAKLAGLRDVHVGVDLDAGAALAEIEIVRERITALAARSPHIDVKVDAARALAELAAVGAAASAVGAIQSAGSGPSPSGLTGIASALSSSGAAAAASAVAMALLASALIPVAAGFAAVTAAAALAATVIGGAVIAAVVGVLPIIKTLTALSAADKQSATSAATAATARVAAVEAARTATASLANTVANADSAALRSAEAVTNARRAVADAVRESTQAVTRAVGAQASAEGQLTAAQRVAHDATLALTQARKDAQQQLEDLARATKQGALDERQGVLSIEEARQRLQDVNANPLATSTDRRQARLDYDQAVQQLDDIHARNTDLAKTKAAADAAGIAGAKGVLSAQQSLADATQRVADAQKAVVDAGLAVVEARRAGAESIAKAEASVTDALRSQNDQARQSAFAISQAQAAVANAQRQQRTALAASGTAAAEAKRQFDSLSPAAQGFVTFLRSTFLPALHNVTTAATNGIAPGLARGLAALVPVLPAVATGFGRLSKAAGDLFASAGQALASPFWADFFDNITNLAGPAVAGFGHVIGDVAKGFGGLLIAFEPISAKIGAAVGHIADKFAAWGTSAGKGGSLDKFLTFLNDKGPQIARDLADVAKAVGNIVVAAAPIGLAVLNAIGLFAAAINALATPLKMIGALIGKAFDLRQIATSFAQAGRLIATASVGMFDGLKDAFKASINYIVDAWNGLSFKLPSVDTHIPGVGRIGGFELGTPDIPRLALGGIVTAPTLALIGEGREPEAVFPLSQLDAFLASARPTGRALDGDAKAHGNRPIIESFVQNNHHPAYAATNPDEAMRRLQWGLGGL